MSKKGSEIVEAALVLPLIILTISSLIMLVIYFYDCLDTQVKTHHSLITYADNTKLIFATKKKSEETSSNIGGVVSMVMSKRRDSEIYIIDEAAAIRIGDFFGDE